MHCVSDFVLKTWWLPVILAVQVASDDMECITQFFCVHNLTDGVCVCSVTNEGMKTKQPPPSKW